MKKTLTLGAILIASLLYGQVGYLDNTFGNHGIVFTDFDTSTDFLNAMTLLPNGKIVATGTSNFMQSLVRYNPDGNLDSTFGSYGKVVFDTALLSGINADAVALQPDGKIVIGGMASTGANPYAIVRYNSDGSLDTLFSNDGYLTRTPNYGSLPLSSIVIQSDGKILGAGVFDPLPPLSSKSLFLIRHLSNGVPDSSFGGDGYMLSPTPFSTTNLLRISPILLRSDGKFLIGGYLNPVSPYWTKVARFNSDGSLDTTFNRSGYCSTLESGEFGHVVLEQPDGKILVTGNKLNAGQLDILIVRFNENGTIDSTFGVNGKIVYVTPTIAEGVENSVLQPDGKIVIGGTYGPSGSAQSFFVSRFNADGAIDSSFGINGVLITSFQSNVGTSKNSLLIQPDGKIVLGGYAGNIQSYDFTLIRYNTHFVPQCSAGFTIYPDSTNQGVYYGYEQSTGNNLTYLWKFGDGDTSTQQYPSHTYAAPGQYYVCLTVTDGAGCIDTYCDSSFYVFKTEGGLMSQLNILDPNAPVGVDDVKDEPRISIHPNPANEFLTITVTGSSTEQVSIYSIDGKLLKEIKQSANNIVDVSSLSNGVYIAEVKAGDIVQRVRWVKM